MPKFFLCSFRPLCSTKQGRSVVDEKRDLPPFIDGSCRREPDLQAAYPSISALCRAGSFARRLNVGDKVAYITCKIQATSDMPWSRYLVAVLEVLVRYETHLPAADWYRERKLPPPSNCMVDGNLPLPYDRTSGIQSAKNRVRFELHRGESVALRNWNASYVARAEVWGQFLICQPIYKNLSKPPELTEATLIQIFGRVPGTQNPPAIKSEQMAALTTIARIDRGAGG